GSENVWSVRACDSFSSTERAEITMRCVVLKEDGSYLEPEKEDSTAIYMNKKTIGERLSLIKKIKESNDPVVLKLRVWNSKLGDYTYLIPSHPCEDADYVLGGDERYKPTNFNTVIDLCKKIGLVDLSEIYQQIYTEYYEINES